MNKLLIIFLYLVVLTAPLFPGKGAFGFYSVEWSFYTLAVLFFLIVFFAILKGDFKISWDPFFNIFIIFIILAALSMIKATNRFRALLYLLQYFPMFALCIIVSLAIDNYKKLKNYMTEVSYLCIIFCVIVIAVGFYYRDRNMLNEFLLNYFNISVNKILTFIGLPFCVSVYKTINQKQKQYDLLLLVVGTLAIIVSGSRGSLFMVAFMLLIITFRENLIKGLAILLLTASLFGLLVYIFPYTKERLAKVIISSETDYYQNITSFSRIYTGLVAVRVIMDNPLTGVGIGQLNTVVELAAKKSNLNFRIIDYWEKKNIFETTAIPLLYGAELGILGIIIFLAIYYQLFKRIRNISYYSKDYEIICRSMEIYLITSFFHNFLDRSLTNYYVWGYIGIIIATIRLGEAYRSQKLESPSLLRKLPIPIYKNPLRTGVTN